MHRRHLFSPDTVNNLGQEFVNQSDTLRFAFYTSLCRTDWNILKVWDIKTATNIRVWC